MNEVIFKRRITSERQTSYREIYSHPSEMVNVCLVSLLLAAVSVYVQLSDGTKDDPCDPDIPSRLMPEPTATTKTQLPCGRGQYRSEQKGCVSCEDGTFMTSKMDESKKYAKCLPCQKPLENELVTEACNTSRDTLIMCKNNYYRNRPNNSITCESECVLCATCGAGSNSNLNYAFGNCSDYSNVVCCHSEDMIVVDGNCAHTTSPSPTTKYTTTTTSNSSADVTSGLLSFVSITAIVSLLC